MGAMASDSDIEEPAIHARTSAELRSHAAAPDVAESDDGPMRLALQWRPSGFAVAVAVVSVWGAIANLLRLGFPVFAFDEPFYAIAGWRYVHGEHGTPPAGLPSNFDNFEHPPLAKYLYGLAQLVAGHPSVEADRVVAALCTLGSAAVLGVWLGRVAGRWVGLGAAALVAVLPMSAENLPFRFGRYGLLDPVAELFAVGSVALSWVWFRRSGRTGWLFAIATGACVGLAAASKENGFLGAVGPVIAGLALSARHLRAAVERVLQVLAATTVSLVVFVTTYVGLGRPSDDIRYIFRYQREHARLGHTVHFAGRVATHPPGWAFLWFAQHGVGAVVGVACLVCVLAAIVLRRDRLVLWCVAALAGPLFFHMVLARVVLSFYWVMWMPAFLALVALGVAELVALIRSPGRAWRVTGPAVAASCVVVLGVASAHDTYRMLSRPVPRHVSYTAAVLERSPLVYLRLDEPSGTTAADSSGNGHPAAYSGRPRLQAAGLLSGDPDAAVAFNGAGQFASIPGAAWMNVPDYSFAVWFSGSKAGRYLLARDDFRSKVWNLQFDASGHVRFVTYASFGGGGQPVDSRGAYNDGHRHLAVCVKQGSSTLLYVDGELAGSASWRTFATSATAAIDLGRRGNNRGFFAGTLDEFAFYDTVLSADDALALYRAGTVAGPGAH